MRVVHNCLIILMMSCFLIACSVSKEARTMKRSINGSWILQTVNTEGITAKFAAKIFDEADLNCFIGSTWNFISNNNTGSYKLIGGGTGCATLQRNILWTIYEQNDVPKEFQFKRLDEKNNPLDGNNGFRLDVTTLNNTTMELKSAITFEGKPGNIVYNFIKK